MEREAAERIVDAVLSDLQKRRGLRQEWDGIDEDIQDEIRKEWIRLTVTAANAT